MTQQSSSRNIYLIGCPSDLGGADTEAWHALRIFQKHGMGVHVVPTWQATSNWGGPPGWDKKLIAAGFQVHNANLATLTQVPGLAGSLVISFCNGEFLKSLPALNALKCKSIWLNCMTFAFDAEQQMAEPENRPAAWVMQSRFQHTSLMAAYAERGLPVAEVAPHCHIIPGAFLPSDFKFQPRPHASKGLFTFGRMARADKDKWSSNTWKIYERVQYANKAALAMGVNDAIKDKLGDPPEFVGYLPVNAIPVPQFLKSLHCLLAINGGAKENWPRAGLEAFAAGVPVVTQNLWGWREMIDHGRTGFLADCDEELAHYTAQLAYDEPLRLRIAKQARNRLRDEFCDSDYNWSLWQKLFDSLV